MYKIFQIPKEAGTYADALEAYGVANLISKVLSEISHKIIINDKDSYYEIISNKGISNEIINDLKYFQVVKFIQKDEKVKPPKNIGQDFYNYPVQRDLRKQRKLELEKAFKDSKSKDYASKKKLILAKYQSEKAVQPIMDEYDVFAQLISNPYAAFLKLYNNFETNQAYFKTLITEILNQYLPKDNQFSSDYAELVKTKKIKLEEKATMLQLLNPNQGKGLNKSKATGMSAGNLKGGWIKETMKVSGALKLGMICQSVKVGGSYDLKVFVPAFNNIQLSRKTQILKKFKRSARSNSPIKLDIFNMLNIIDLFIESHPKYKDSVKNTLLGLYSVYQKDLGQNKAVANIGFLETPDFIKIESEDDGEDWRDFIENQKKVINGITELGDAMIGLLAYRNFLSGSNINEYFKFNYWYAAYLMHELSNKKQTYVTTNKIEILNKIFILMDNSFKDIIENEGFLSIAAAIRKSTVSLQYTPKDQRKFDVQYGLAQKLQNKSKSPQDLIAFVSEFIAKYNSDTARQFEKKGQYFRANVKNQELQQFYVLADKVDSKVLGAMLAAYGFALNKKDKPEENKQD